MIARNPSHGLDLSDRTPRPYEAVEPADVVVSVCDLTREARPGFGDHPLHWSIADPADTGTDDAFETVFTQILARVDRLVPHVSARV